MTSETTRYLLALAQRNMTPYLGLPQIRAAIITGSVAQGETDTYSDIDTILYYDELPTDEQLDAARQTNQGGEFNWRLGDRAEGTVIDSYHVAGVECQFAHSTIAAWEREMATVLEECDVSSPIQKALSGLLYGIPVYGEPLIGEWRALASRYPDALARAMIEKHLQFVPLWGLYERLSTRDATVWRYQILVESAQNLLAVLAGLNRLYYSSFQFKRMRAFIREMKIQPLDLANRLEGLFASDAKASGEQLEALVSETLDLVALHRPEVDITPARRRLGWRARAWHPLADGGES